VSAALQDLTSHAKGKAFTLKDATKDTSESSYQAALKKIADARAAASAKLEETRAAAETQWSKPSSLWDRVLPAQRTPSQKAWDSAQVCSRLAAQACEHVWTWCCGWCRLCACDYEMGFPVGLCS